MWMITVLIFCTQFHTWNKTEGMMDYPGKAFLPPVLQSIQIRFRKWITLQLHHCLVYVFHDNEVGIDNAVLCCCVCPQRTLCCCCVRPSSGKCLSVSSRRSGWSWQERTQTTPIQWKVDCLTRHPTTSTAGKSMSLLLSVCLVCVCFIHSWTFCFSALLLSSFVICICLW